MAEQNSGTTSKLIFGIGALIITTIVVLVVVSTMMNANLLRSTATTFTVTDEVGTVTTGGYHLKNAEALNHTFTVVTIVNSTAGGLLIPSTNYTFNSVTGNITNSSASPTQWAAAKINYTYIGGTVYELSSDALTKNMTAGVDNVSKQLPTILLIAAVVLLFGVIVLLVRQSQLMGINSGGSL